MADSQLDDIVKQNTPRLRSYVRSRVGNRDDADDIVQDTLYQLVRAINIMDNPIGKVSSWLYSVAHNLIVNHGKKRRELEMPRRQGTHANDDDAIMADISEIMIASPDDSPDLLVLRGMVWEELDKALSELSDEQRQALEMTEIQGHSVKEAARQMGVPLNTFLSRKHYAVLHVRKRLLSLYEELITSHSL